MELDGRNLSHFFTIRLWFEPLTQDEVSVRIKVHHVLSGDVRYFRDWLRAVEFIAEYSISEEKQLSNTEEESVCKD